MKASDPDPMPDPETIVHRVRPPRRSSAPEKSGRDAGASTVELMLWFPGLIMIVVMVLQVFSYVWARETAHNAARYGAYHARVLGGTDEDGRREASTYLREVAGTLVEDPAIVVSRTAERVDVTITARPRQIPLPGIDLPRFTVHVSGPIEQFTAGT